MFVLGLIIFGVTCLVAWISGDTESVTRGNPAYAIPLGIGAWLMFANLRRALFGRA